MRPYGYRWRALTRPLALQRAGGRVEPVYRRGRIVRYQYLGAARCQKCGWRDPDFTLARKRTRSRLDVAHLDGNNRNDAEDNLAVLCHQGCHRAHDLPQWIPQFQRTVRRNRAMAVVILTLAKDAARPLLREVRSEQ